MEKYVVAYDIGTTGVKTCLFRIDQIITLLASDSMGYGLTVLPDGGVEQNVDEWWEAMCVTTKKIFAESSVRPEQVDGISFCKYLTIRIKGEAGGEENKLIMDWHPEDSKFYAARFSDLVLADGSHPVITTEWQDLVIDLEASGFPGMTNAFHIRAFAKCVIWLDEITFSEAVAPVDATSAETILAGMTVPETGKPADLPIKDFVAELGE